MDTALRRFVALSLKGERHKTLATYPSCLESYILESENRYIDVRFFICYRTSELRIAKILAYIKNLSTLFLPFSDFGILAV